MDKRPKMVSIDTLPLQVGLFWRGPRPGKAGQALAGRAKPGPAEKPHLPRGLKFTLLCWPMRSGQAEVVRQPSVCFFPRQACAPTGAQPRSRVGQHLGLGGCPAKRDKPVRPFASLKINYGEGRQAPAASAGQALHIREG